MHVTVKFLGHVSPEQETGARELTCRTAAGHSGPVSSILGLSAFSSPRRARVLVVRLAADPTLTGLAELVEHGAAKLGVAAERRSFRPHVTLARLRRPSNVESWVDGVTLPLATIRFEELVLFRSDPGPTGSRYTPLLRVSLGG
jgi:2'-5' RNA ligase